MAKLLKIIIFLMMIFSTRAYALSMGSLVKNDFDSIAIGDSAKFTVLFWNIENDYKVELNVKEAPKDWIVIIEPNSFILNSSVGKDYIKLPYMNESIKTTPVDIIVKPSESSKLAKYNVIITAKAESPTNGISFSQERVFKFVIEISNPLFFENSEKQNDVQIKENKNTQIEHPVTNQEKANFNYFYAIIIVLIFLISFLIYKYS